MNHFIFHTKKNINYNWSITKMNSREKSIEWKKKHHVKNNIHSPPKPNDKWRFVRIIHIHTHKRTRTHRHESWKIYSHTTRIAINLMNIQYCVWHSEQLTGSYDDRKNGTFTQIRKIARVKLILRYIKITRDNNICVFSSYFCFKNIWFDLET